MNEFTQERNRILASIVKSALNAHQIASDMNELTQEKPFTCEYCKKEL